MVIGATLLGKTTFIRHQLHFAGLRHAYFQGDWALDQWDNSVDVCIFDDVTFEFIKGRKQFWGCQKDFIVWDRFRAKRKIAGGIPMVYICNNEDDYLVARTKHDNRPVLNLNEVDWYNKNTKRVEIIDKMYR